MPLDPVAVINPIIATLDFGATSRLKRDRLTVIVGDGLPGPGGTGFVNDGDFSQRASPSASTTRAWTRPSR